MAIQDENILNFGYDLVLTVGSTGALQKANGPALAVLGLSETELTGRNIRDWVVIDSIAEWDMCLEAADAGVAVSGANITLKTPLEPELMVEANLQPSAQEVIVYLRSLNEQQRVQQLLLESEARLRDVLTAIPDLVIVFDKDGRYRQVYTGDEDVLVAPAEELPGKLLHEMVQPEEAERGLQRIQDAIATQELQQFEHSLSIRGEERWFSAKVVPMESSHDPRVLWVSRDVTAVVQARRQKEHDTQLLRDLLQLEQKARDVVAYEIHDGFVQYAVGTQMWLQSGIDQIPSDAEDARDTLETALDSIEQAIADARAMIGDLRPVALEAGGLVKGLQQLIEFMQRKSTASIVLLCHEEPPTLLPLLENQIFRMVQESLNNMIRHSKATHATVDLDTVGEEILLKIADNGCGFDPKAIPVGHFGIEGILRRAQVFGGTGAISSTMGEGAEITIRMPILKPGQ